MNSFSYIQHISDLHWLTEIVFRLNVFATHFVQNCYILKFEWFPTIRRQIIIQETAISAKYFLKEWNVLIGLFHCWGFIVKVLSCKGFYELFWKFKICYTYFPDYLDLANLVKKHVRNCGKGMMFFSWYLLPNKRCKWQKNKLWRAGSSNFLSCPSTFFYWSITIY